MLSVISRLITAFLMLTIHLNLSLEKKKIKEQKSKLSVQQWIFTRPVVKCKYATIASFKIAHLLAKKKKLFQDDELLKEAILTGAD
jgi:hypothetical protein